MPREPEYPSGFGNDFLELSFLSGSLLGAEGQNEASLETWTYRACSVIGKEPTIPSKKTTRQKEANTEHPSSLAQRLLQHGHSFSVQCSVSRKKTFITTNTVIAFGAEGNRKLVYHTENGLNCVQWNIPWGPQGSGSFSLGEKTEEEDMRLSIPGVIFSSPADRKLSDFMAGHLQGDIKTVLLPSILARAQLLLPSAHSGSCWDTFFFWEWPLANCNSGHNAATMPERCAVTAYREHRNCAGHS